MNKYMKQCNKCNLEKSLTDFHKDSSAKDGHRNTCKFCKARHDKIFQGENSDKYCAQRKTYREANIDKERARGRAWSKQNYIDNRDKVLVLQKNYALKNKDLIVEKQRIYREKNLEELKAKDRQYYQDNKHIRFAGNAKRRAAKLQATPNWANQGAIKSIYKQREEISKSTGIVHHVDHIIPLRGKYVSGLHVENNLRIIPARENLSKNNKHFDE